MSAYHDILTHKVKTFTKHIEHGFRVDTDAPSGAPKGAVLKLVIAQDGGLGGTEILAAISLRRNSETQKGKLEYSLSDDFI